MSVRTFTKAIPLSMTDVLVTYDEDGTLRNIIISDPQLAADCWGVQAQQAAIQKANDSAVMDAQAERNDVVGAVEEVYQKALADAQQTFADAVEAAAQAKAKALLPVQAQIDTVTARAFAAANKLLPPTTKADAQPAQALIPSS